MTSSQKLKKQGHSSSYNLPPHTTKITPIPRKALTHPYIRAKSARHPKTHIAPHWPTGKSKPRFSLSPIYSRLSLSLCLSSLCSNAAVAAPQLQQTLYDALLEMTSPRRLCSFLFSLPARREHTYIHTHILVVSFFGRSFARPFQFPSRRGFTIH